MPPTINIQSNATPFIDLQAAVLETFKRTDKTTELKRALNSTFREMVTCVVARKLEDQIYQVCTIGQEDYALPDTILRVNHPLRLIEPNSTNNSSESYPLKFFTKTEYDEFEPNPNATKADGSPNVIPGRPWAYTFYKNSFLLTEIPDKAYLIEANVGGEPIPMEADGDATIFSPVWDEVIISGALARLYSGITLKEEAAYWMNIYRYGFTGDKDHITGGLEIFKRITSDLPKAPIRVRPRYF